MTEYCECEIPSINIDDCSGTYQRCYNCKKRNRNKKDYDIMMKNIPYFEESAFQTNSIYKGFDQASGTYQVNQQTMTTIPANCITGNTDGPSSSISVGNNMVAVQVKLDENAVMPAYGRVGDAALDLSASESVIIPSLFRTFWIYLKHLVFGPSFYDVKTKAESEEIETDNPFATKVKTGVYLELPPNHVGLIHDRSGLSSKHLIIKVAGVLDETYRGEIVVCLVNLSFRDYQINRGDRIAQLIIMPYKTAILYKTDKLNESVRNEGGFGSSGV